MALTTPRFRPAGVTSATGDETGPRDYSAVCLQHTWAYQEFSRWMTEMLSSAS